MNRKMILRRYGRKLVLFFMIMLLASACGKKEQIGAEASGNVPCEENSQETSREAAGTPEQDAGDDYRDADPHADDRGGLPGENSAQEEPGSAGEGQGALESADGLQSAESENNRDLNEDGMQDGQSRETGVVRNGQNPDGNDRRTAAPSAAGTTPFGAHGALSVSGTQLVDTYGAPYQLRGVSTHGLSWFPQYANKEAFRTMRDEWGVNVVRLAMYTAEYGGYCVGDQDNQNRLKQLVYDSVDAATELGMYVIVDWHVLNDRDPNTYIDQAIAFFRETAERYAAYGNVIYEICNEPNGGVSWQSVKSYAEQVIPVIREQDADAVIIVGTPTWSQDVDKAAANPITGHQNIMYALHFYADTHRDSLRQKMVNAIAAGLPIFVSEYGICDASGSGAVNRSQADQWVSTMDENGVSYCIWNLSNKSETSALIRSNVTATSGWSYEDLSDSGKWFVDMMGADHAVIGSTGPGGASGNAGVNSNGSTGSSGTADGGNGTSGNGGTTNSADGSSGTGSAGNGGGAAQNVTSDASGTLQASLSLTNSWETDGKHFYQYSLEVKNVSGAGVNGWTCEISFNRSVSVSQSWCGSFSVSGSSVTITPETYNAAIEAGASQSNVGFILETDDALTVTEVTCR